MYDGTICDYFPVNIGIRQTCVLAPTPFNSCMVHVLGRVPKNSGCGVSFATVRFTDLDFADDAVIFAETTAGLAGALDLLSKGADPLGLQVSWIRIHSSNSQLRSRSQSTTGTSLEHNEFAGRRCVALPIPVQRDEGPSLSLASPPGLAVFL